MTQAGVYSSTMHYLRAVDAAGTDATDPVIEEMKATPIYDFFTHNGRIREEGRMVHDMCLYDVKKPSESRAFWDFYKLAATIPADEAFLPPTQSKCLLVKKTQWSNHKCKGGRALWTIVGGMGTMDVTAGVAAIGLRDAWTVARMATQQPAKWTAPRRDLDKTCRTI
jgi:hypothetical protein